MVCLLAGALVPWPWSWLWSWPRSRPWSWLWSWPWPCCGSRGRCRRRGRGPVAAAVVVAVVVAVVATAVAVVVAVVAVAVAIVVSRLPRPTSRPWLSFFFGALQRTMSSTFHAAAPSKLSCGSAPPGWQAFDFSVGTAAASPWVCLTAASTGINCTIAVACHRQRG